MDINNPTSVAIDVAVILCSGIAIQCLKLLCRKKAYPLIATQLFKLEPNGHDTYHFSKQLWSFTWHSISFVMELIVVLPSHFWTSTVNPYNKTYGTTLFWINTGAPTITTRILYLTQIGYYTTDFLYQQVIDKPNDYITMGVHHVAALFLLWMSYLPPLSWKIGCAILLVHDLGDVSLKFTKSLHYAKLDTIANVVFMIHILLWIWTRLIWFPRYIASIIIDVDLMQGVWQRIPSAIFLTTLLLLHVYWTFLMLRVLYKAVVKKEKLADDRDRVIKKGEDDKEDVAIDLDEMDKLKHEDRTDVVDDAESQKPIMRRRSSLMGSYIESNDNVLSSIAQTKHKALVD